MSQSVTIANNQTVELSRIPVLNYDDFLGFNTGLLHKESHHCVNYFGFPDNGKLKLVCCVANDDHATLVISSTEVDPGAEYPSFTARQSAFQIFERVLHENFGMSFTDHPWLKPVRYPADRFDKTSGIRNYPFYEIKSEELHEVGVGPIHAGIIEPGHFRFICNGEQILHLEVQHGYQHRGVEQLFVASKKLLQRSLLAESIAGDSVAGHATAFANVWEALSGFSATPDMRFARTVAIELERMAIHTGDLSGICTDIGYQLGSAVFGRLRTPIINFFQEWCGNRLAKSLVRPGRNPFHFGQELVDRLEELFNQYERDFDEIWKEFHTLPSALARLEKTSVITREVAAGIGAVGMTARAAGLMRDVRTTHPHDLYTEFSPITIVKHHGDVYSRAKLRHDEIVQSLYYLKRIIRKPPGKDGNPPPLGPLKPRSLGVSLTEGWRGEICHCAVTDAKGDLIQYRIKDPSMHNWLAVAVAVRNNEISDFPITNKSFDLSYCGHDL